MFSGRGVFGNYRIGRGGEKGPSLTDVLVVYLLLTECS